MNTLAALLWGLLFGLGLIVSGMVEPQKVLGFLDVTGLWNPSLAFVMAGAVSVAIVAFAIARRRHPAPAQRSTRITVRLVVGALIFGIGWGLAGICPGPAIVLLGIPSSEGWVFALGMVGGMLLFSVWDRKPG